MSGKLAYKDYFLSKKKGNVIMTQDGRLFATERMQVRSEILRYLFILIVLIIFSPLVVRYDLWPGSFYDFAFVCGTLTFGVFLLMPRLLRFTELKPDSPEYQEALSWFSSPNRHVNKASFVIMHAVIAAALLTSLLSSHMAELVCSVFDSQPRVASLEIVQYGITVYPSDNGEAPGLITLANADGELSVRAVVSRTTDEAELSLDGKPLDNRLWHKSRLPHEFWQSEYLRQIYDCLLTGIRDGSVLTLTCGGLVREWVFEVPDKEAS